MALHTMAILQAYQADVLKEMDEGASLTPEAVKELRKATDLALTSQRFVRRRRFFSWTPAFPKLGYSGRRLAWWWRYFALLNHSRQLSSSSYPGGWGTTQTLPPPTCPKSAPYQGRSPPAGAAPWLSPPTMVWGACGQPFPPRCNL